MKFLLDTNVLSEAINTTPNLNVLKMMELHQGEIATAAPVWHELRYGSERLGKSKKKEILETFLQGAILPNVPILPYDQRAAEWHAQKRASLSSMGKTPSFVDGQIAAIAFVNGLVMVTRNGSDFQCLEDLRIANWHGD
ncbi:MAG: type II toxin-antitoxin system VapC family toxin [Desulfobacterales bacterium]|nr:type II toxin-antitoxin system VapC family toxin [Desulfobacterales bacterium]